jgi:hypothetical protein
LAQDAVETKAREFIAKNPGARATKVLVAMLERGSISTEELLDLGYKHAPRARMDVVDNGFPVKTTMVKGSDGRRMASYSLLSETEMREAQQGRSIIPKVFKAKLVAHYGEVDGITGWQVTARALQVDHRIPYQVGGDAGLENEDVSAFMLLTGSSQRAKSFSCERCPNFLELKDPDICGGCYWAFPESYDHIAMQQVRRLEVVWQDAEAATFDAIKARLTAKGESVEAAIKRLLATELDD